MIFLLIYYSQKYHWTKTITTYNAFINIKLKLNWPQYIFDINLELVLKIHKNKIKKQVALCINLHSPKQYYKQQNNNKKR